MEYHIDHRLVQQYQKLRSKINELSSKNLQVEAECEALKRRDTIQCRVIKCLEQQNKSEQERSNTLKEQNEILADRCNEDVPLRRENAKLKENTILLTAQIQRIQGFVTNACVPRTQCEGFVVPDDDHVDYDAEYQQGAGCSDISDVDEASSDTSDTSSDITMDEELDTTAPRQLRSDKQKHSAHHMARTVIPDRSSDIRRAVNARSAAQPAKKKRRHSMIDDDEDLVQDMREASIQPGARVACHAQRKQSTLAKRRITQSYHDWPELSD